MGCSCSSAKVGSWSTGCSHSSSKVGQHAAAAALEIAPVRGASRVVWPQRTTHEQSPRAPCTGSLRCAEATTVGSWPAPVARATVDEQGQAKGNM